MVDPKEGICVSRNLDGLNVSLLNVADRPAQGLVGGNADLRNPYCNDVT